MKRLSALVVAAALATAGCSTSGGGSSSTSGGVGTTYADTFTPPPSTPATTATVSQYASLVAKDKHAIQNQAQKIAYCHGFYSLSDLGCSIGWGTVAMTVEILRIDLNGAMKPTAGQYLGDPPAEIAGLVQQTLAATRAMKAANNKLQEHCVNHAQRGACELAAFNWQNALDDVMAQLAAWKPYGA